MSDGFCHITCKIESGDAFAQNPKGAAVTQILDKLVISEEPGQCAGLPLGENQLGPIGKRDGETRTNTRYSADRGQWIEKCKGRRFLGSI